MTEEWRDVEGFPAYEISNMGNVRRKESQRILATHGTPFGYRRVVLFKEGKRYDRALHILVLKAFVGERPKDHAPSFKNGDKRDCRLENLEWRFRLGKDTIYKLPNLYQAPLTSEDAETGAGSSAHVVRRW